MSLTHLLLLTGIGLLVFGPKAVPRLGRTLGSGVREFKRGLRGEGDIDVTESVQRIEDDER